MFSLMKYLNIAEWTKLRSDKLRRRLCKCTVAIIMLIVMCVHYFTTFDHIRLSAFTAHKIHCGRLQGVYYESLGCYCPGDQYSTCYLQLSNESIPLLNDNVASKEDLMANCEYDGEFEQVVPSELSCSNNLEFLSASNVWVDLRKARKQNFDKRSKEFAEIDFTVTEYDPQVL
ncbi:MAG: hypothetical protein MHMPM18_001774 [Marteilia pararefringens]